MWAGGDTSVPGPVLGYLRLLEGLTPEQRGRELSRLPGRDKMFDEGLYRFQYSVQSKGDADADVAQAFCVLRAGRMFGADPWGGVFHGSYNFRPTLGTTYVHVVLSVPPEGMLITGEVVGPDGGVFEIVGVFEKAAPTARSTVKVDGTPVDVALTFLGALP